MAETFVNQNFGAGQASTGILLGSTFTGTNIASGAAAISINGNVNLPGSPVTVNANLVGLVGAGLQGTYLGFSQPQGSTEPIYYFSVSPGGLQTPVTVAVSAAPLTPVNLLTPVNTTGTVSAPDSPTIVCYLAGTLIRTAEGEVAVEDLAIGDLVVTASGAERPIKWIGTRHYSGRFANANPAVLPVRFAAGSLAEGVPARDLWVSPKHAMFLDGVLIPAECLVNGVTITKTERIEEVTYYHVELDSHDVLIAEGAESESFVDDNGRGIFHNAHAFHALYPDEARTDAVYCAPRVESGYALEAVRRRLAERAEIAVPAARVFGELRGHIDDCHIDAVGRVTVAGWAQDLAHPDGPVCLDIVVDGVVAALTFAEGFRADLEQAGIGNGCHAFRLTLPALVADGAPHTVEVRRASDGSSLVGPRLIEAPVLMAA